MTVAELIAMLQKLPPEAPVLTGTYGYDLEPDEVVVLPSGAVMLGS